MVPRCMLWRELHRRPWDHAIIRYSLLIDEADTTRRSGDEKMVMRMQAERMRVCCTSGRERGQGRGKQRIAANRASNVNALVERTAWDYGWYPWRDRSRWMTTRRDGTGQDGNAEHNANLWCPHLADPHPTPSPVTIHRRQTQEAASQPARTR